MNLSEDDRITIGNIMTKIAQLKTDKMYTKTAEERGKIDMKISELKLQKKQVISGIDPKLYIETREHIDYMSQNIDAKSLSLEEFKKEGFCDGYHYIHFCESGIIWKINKSKTFTMVATQIDVGRNLFLDNQQKFILISSNDKQLFNIPTIARPIETYESEIENLCEVIIAFMKDVYQIDIKRKDLILSKCKKYPIIIIPKHHVNSTDEKRKIICNLQSYIGQNYKTDVASLLDARIKGYLPYYSFPQVEGFRMITEKTVDAKTYEYLRKEPNHAFFSDIGDSKLIPNNITLNTNVDNRITIDNSVTIDKSVTNNVNINESQNVNVVQESPNATVTNTANTNNIKIHKIHNMNEYIHFISNTPPAWHVKNKVVDIQKLYSLYTDIIGGTGQKSQFGKFLTSLSTNYKKIPVKKRTGNVIPTQYMIIK